jgi:hypothetical protein
LIRVRRQPWTRDVRIMWRMVGQAPLTPDSSAGITDPTTVDGWPRRIPGERCVRWPVVERFDVASGFVPADRGGLRQPDRLHESALRPPKVRSPSAIGASPETRRGRPGRFSKARGRGLVGGVWGIFDVLPQTLVTILSLGSFGGSGQMFVGAARRRGAGVVLVAVMPVGGPNVGAR